MAARRLASVTSSRADHGILGRVWQALAALPGIDLTVVATGMNHVDPAELERLIPDRADRCWLGRDIGGAGARTATEAVAQSVGEWATLLEAGRFDLLLLAGDRLDMLPAAIAALPARLPVLHLHGGEVTLGAFDEQIRHAISKMAHIHLTANAAAAARLCRMGEEPWRIHITGAPAIDSLRAMAPLDRADFFAAIEMAPTDLLRLVTVHPETNAAAPLAPARAVAAALAARPRPTLVTAANSDPGGREIRALFATLSDAHDWLTLRGSLGTELYRGALEHAALMVGNSSSGLIEAPVFGLRVINVGRRQEGRPEGPGVATCAAEADAVVNALDAADRERVSGQRFACFSGFGDGQASERIATVVAGLGTREILLAKRFHDGPVPEFQEPWSD